jgi:hypothetical protein
MRNKPTAPPLLDLTPPEYLAYVHKKHGREHLKELLQHTIEKVRPISSENLEKWAEELKSVGLLSVANVLQDVASTAPHEWEFTPPYPADCKSLIAEWKEKMEIKRKNYEANSASAK